MTRQITRQVKRLGMFAVAIALSLTACATSPSAQPEATLAPIETATSQPAATAAPAQDASGAATGMRVFVIVPEESSASYMMDEEFLSGMLAKYGIAAGRQDTTGTTQAIEGQFALNWDDLTSPLGENQFSVDLTTLTSDQRLRDSWLRENGPEFNTYPTATFVAERLDNAPTTYTEGDEVSFQMVGQLTVHEVTQPATFNVTASLSGDTVKGVAETTTLLTNFGIEPPNFANTLTVQDEFQIRVEFAAREQ